MTRKEQFVLVFVAAAVVTGAAVIAWRTGAPAESIDAQPGEAAVIPLANPAPEADPVIDGAPEAPESPVVVLPAEKVIVSLQGAVERPAVYTMAPDDRVNDLLEEGGGPLEDASTAAINLAAPLVDGTTLTVPWRNRPLPPNPAAYLIGTESPASTPVQTHAQSTPTTQGTGLVNINTATKDQLMALSGIGPVYAERIIEYRANQPFRTVDELTNIRGIGEKTLAALRDHVTVR